MRCLRIIFTVLLIANFYTILFAEETKLKCGQAQTGEITAGSEANAAVGGTYTYGAWLFQAKAGEKNIFRYGDLDVSGKGKESPKKYLIALKVFATATMERDSTVEVFPLSVTPASGNPEEFQSAAFIDSESGGIGVTLIEDGSFEVVVLMKEFKPKDLKKFSLGGCSALTKK